MAKTNTDLWRAIINGSIDGPFVKDGEPAPGVLYPRFEDSTYIDAQNIERTSKADVTVHRVDGTDARDEVDAGGGTSLFDVCGWFGHGVWRYFKIPNGTEIPANLFIRKGKNVRTNKSGTLSGRHYQIEPLNRMTIAEYKGALDNFARAAVVRSLETV